MMAAPEAAYAHDLSAMVGRQFPTAIPNAPHLHICGTCYGGHNATTHVGAPCVGSGWSDAGDSHADRPKEQNAYPISRSGHSAASVPRPPQFIAKLSGIFHMTLDCAQICKQKYEH
jgi:hypothetical protein